MSEQNELAIWMCLQCQRTVSAPAIGYWTPNTICRCNGNANVMVRLWPRGADPDAAQNPQPASHICRECGQRVPLGSARP